MFIWVKLILTCLDFVPMILFSLVLFRQRIKPFRIQISLAALAGTLVTFFDNWPLFYVSIICAALMIVWKFSLVPSLIIALSGYFLSIIVSTGVLIGCDMMDWISYAELETDLNTSTMVLLIALIAKFTMLFALLKLRLGFTFLTHYTRIPFTHENAGFYLFIIVVIIGITYRHSYPDSVLSALMPIQMLSVATVLFIYVMLSKELRFQR
ncbi:hypothetical protein LOZ80_24560 [Paenibacillus sp. HWE-109]|uniref:hypothetical protein n=1 Tax=Paenibacillus sp. HWE-109 TaxID=1306526 RepID=UPI001EDF2085|nr:hypothetical protein [Paenibacillus sp. HWE-109]UKS24766.1 hypothetical protein LOZ80_24560 [Paenibacillus sp. HWE-109]